MLWKALEDGVGVNSPDVLGRVVFLSPLDEVKWKQRGKEILARLTVRLTNPPGWKWAPRGSRPVRRAKRRGIGPHTPRAAPCKWTWLCGRDGDWTDWHA